MSDEEIDDHHRVARHLASRDVDNGVLGSAPFLLTEGHDYVSVFHMEYFATSVQVEQLACICGHLAVAHEKGLDGARKVGASHRFAHFDVAGAQQAVALATDKRIVLKAEKRALAGAPFHAGLFGYGMDVVGDLAANALRRVAVVSPPKNALPPMNNCDCSKR